MSDQKCPHCRAGINPNYSGGFCCGTGVRIGAEQTAECEIASLKQKLKQVEDAYRVVEPELYKTRIELDKARESLEHLRKHGVITRKEFLQLPIEQRREIMGWQAEAQVEHEDEDQWACEDCGYVGPITSFHGIQYREGDADAVCPKCESTSIEERRSKVIATLRQQLADEKARADKEKATRIKYQDIVYGVALVLDKAFSRPPGNCTLVSNVVADVETLLTRLASAISTIGMREAEVGVLRGQGCEEGGDGPCGVCLKCYQRRAEAAEARETILTNLLKRVGETVTEFVAYYPHGVNPSLDAVYGEAIELQTEITAALEGKP